MACNITSAEQLIYKDKSNNLLTEFHLSDFILQLHQLSDVQQSNCFRSQDCKEKLQLAIPNSESPRLGWLKRQKFIYTLI